MTSSVLPRHLRQNKSSLSSCAAIWKGNMGTRCAQTFVFLILPAGSAGPTDRFARRSFAADAGRGRWRCIAWLSWQPTFAKNGREIAASLRSSQRRDKLAVIYQEVISMLTTFCLCSSLYVPLLWIFKCNVDLIFLYIMKEIEYFSSTLQYC